MNISKKIITYFISLFIILSLSGCSFLFPTPKSRLATIKRDYQKLQMDFDVTINAPFKNSDIDQLEEEYQDLLEDAHSLLKVVLEEEASGVNPSISSDMVKEYYDKIQRKIVICQDLKD